MRTFNSPDWENRLDQRTAEGVIAGVSRRRLTPFGLGSASDLQVVVNHGCNVHICEALYPTLHLLELAVRNRIHDAFKAHYGRPDWYDMPWVGKREHEKVEEARSDLVRRRKATTPDDVIADLTFGFWCSLFDKRYEPATKGDQPWPYLLKPMLPHAPSWARNRALLLGRLEDVREIRNRIFHHEQVVYRAGLMTRHREMLELLSWFSPSVMTHLSHLCRFNAVHESIFSRTMPKPMSQHVTAELG